MVKFEPSGRELIIYPNSEYRQYILDTNLLSIYDESVKAREQHDENVRMIRESDMTLEDKMMAYADSVYRDDNYGERRGRGPYRR